MGFFDKWDNERRSSLQILDDYNWQMEEALRMKLALTKWSKAMKMDNRFCVIGDKSSSGNINRTWFATEAEAVTHAANLLRGRSDTKLLIVEAKKAVQTKADYEVLSLE